MSYPLGGIVVARDPFGSGGQRPYLLVSNETHPFHGEEYVAAVVTTTDRRTDIHQLGTVVYQRIPEHSPLEGEMEDLSAGHPVNPGVYL